MRNWKKIVAILLVILFAYLYAHVSKPHEIYDRKLDSSEYIELGVSRNPVECQFVSKEDSLDALRVKCRIYVEEPEGITEMELLDVKTGEVVASAVLQNDQIQTGKFNEFSFEKVEGCKGKSYKVRLHSEEAGFFCQQDGTLILKTVTKMFDIETFGIVLLFAAYIAGFFRFLYKLFSR